MKKSLKIALVSTLTLAMAFSATLGFAATTHKKTVKHKVKAAVTYPYVSSKTAGTFKVTNINKTTNVAGYKTITVKTGTTSTAYYKLTNLVPVINVVKALGGTSTVSTSGLTTFNYDGATTTLQINTKKGGNGYKIGTVWYANASAIAPKLVTNYSAGSIPVSFNTSSLTISRSKYAAAGLQWVTSAHNSANFMDEIKNYTPLKPYENNNSSYRCINCHNGLGFQGEATASSIQLKDVSINCATCHGRGAALFTVNDVTLADFQAGVGGATFTEVGPSAVCISCHTGRGKTADKIATDGTVSVSGNAPHGSIQTDVLYGFGGYEYGKVMPTSPHAANPESCVGCHMAPTKEGVRSHAFKITDDNAANACGICHTGLNVLERRALADYDGDRQFESIQGEVEGLYHAVDAAILSEVVKTNPTVAKYAIVGGRIQFQDVNGAAVTGVPDKFFYAAWNALTFEVDGSEGIHNPAYMISLLQETYKQIKGVNIPGATLR